MKLNLSSIMLAGGMALSITALTHAPMVQAETSDVIDPGIIWNDEYRSHYEVPKGDYTGRSPYMKQASAMTSKPVVAAPAPAAAPAPMAKTGCMDATWGLIRMTKTMPAEAALGSEFMAQLNLTAAACAGNVIVRDTVPAGASYVKSEPPASVDGDQLVWKIGNLDGGEAKSIKIWFRADKEGTLANCATVSGDPRVCAATVVGKPVLAITKTGTPEIKVGETASYNIVVKSVGSSIAKNVVVTDTVPDGMTAAGGQKTIVFQAGDLAPGQSKSFPVSLRGDKRGNFCNLAAATSSNAEKVEAKACTDVVLHLLNITKTTTDKSLLIGKVASYTITVTNPGDRKETGVVVTDTAAAGTTIVEAVGGSVAGNVATWNVGEVAPGATKTLTVKIQSRTPGNYCNTAKVNSAQGAANSAQACSEWVGVTGVLTEMVDDPDPIPTGDITTFTLRVTNQGTTASIDDLLIKVKLPDELELVAGSASESPTISGKTLTWAVVKNLAPRATVQHTFKAKGVKTGDARTVMEVTTSSRQNAIEEVESTTVY